MIKVLIVAITEMHIIQPTVRTIDAVFSGVYWMVVIWILLQIVCVYNLAREFASNGKRIAYHLYTCASDSVTQQIVHAEINTYCPLWLAQKEQILAQIMNKSG